MIDTGRIKQKTPVLETGREINPWYHLKLPLKITKAITLVCCNVQITASPTEMRLGEYKIQPL
jgi:hypothetical protein